MLLGAQVQRGSMGRRVLHPRELVQEAGGVVACTGVPCQQQEDDKDGRATHGQNLSALSSLRDRSPRGRAHM